MKKTYLPILLSLFLGFSCTSKEQEVQRISEQTYQIVSDSIYTRMPGKILYQDGIVFWEDPTAFDNFMHAIDVRKKTEIAAFANKGEGPYDFTAPLVSLSPKGGFYLTDLNKPLEILYLWNPADSTFVSDARKIQNHNRNVTRMLHLNESQVLHHCPMNDKLFLLYTDDVAGTSFGDRPIQDEMNNPYDVFQGNVEYNPDRKELVYSALSFPYIAVFNGEKDWALKTEVKGHYDYRINEGNLRFSPDTQRGVAMEMALTQDYIVLLQRDTQVEGTIDNKERGRSMKSLPHSLFIYDYNLKLTKIINMPFPMLRLCGDVKTNTVYAMAINPEFELISMNL